MAAKQVGRHDLRSCEVYGCDYKDHLVPFPKKQTEADLFFKWKRFVAMTVSEKVLFLNIYHSSAVSIAN